MTVSTQKLKRLCVAGTPLTTLLAIVLAASGLVRLEDFTPGRLYTGEWRRDRLILLLAIAGFPLVVALCVVIYERLTPTTEQK